MNHAEVSNTGEATGNVLVLYLDGGLNQQPSKLIAIDAATQKQVWNFALDAASVSGVSVDGSTAFVGDTQGVLYAVDVAKGKETWTSRSTGRIEAPPAVSGGLVYTASRELSQGNATIRAVDENTGQQKWIFAQKQLTSTATVKVTK